MRLDVRAWMLAMGATTLVVYALCALWVAISPVGFMATVGYLTHVDLVPLARSITWGSFLSGLVAWTLAVALAAGAFAWGYNALARRPSSQASVSMVRDREIERLRR